MSASEDKKELNSNQNSDKEVEISERFNKLFMQNEPAVNSLPSNVEVSEPAEWVYEFKSNQQLLDEVLKIPKSKNINKEKCKDCNYKKLIISNCNLENIFDNTFSIHINCVTELHLSNSDIKEFPTVIQELHNLTVLNLSYNKLESIPNTLILFEKLRYLNLSNNQIRHKAPKCLELGLNFLKDINLSYNLISSFHFPPKCLPFLECLNLCHNYFEHTPPWLISEKCRRLIKLDLSCNFMINEEFQNRVQEARHVRSSILKSVEYLSLTNCNISLNTLDIVKNFENITYLNISNEFLKQLNNEWKKNTVWDIPLNIFTHHGKITELHISNLSLPTLPSELYILRNLKVLNASHNCLTWLPDTFVKLQNIEVVNLSSNKLIYLPASFNQMKSIKELYIGNNQLSFGEDEINTLCNLEVLDLYNNCFKVMPVSDKQLQKLNKFDISLNYVSVEASLNHNLADGRNALEVYRKYEENMRTTLGVSSFRLSESCFREPENNSDYSESEESQYTYSGEEYEDNQNEGACDDKADKEVEEDWDADTDDDFNPRISFYQQNRDNVVPTDVLTMFAKKYAGENENYFLPSTRHSTYHRKLKSTFTSVAGQFVDAENTD